jgi:tRNA dimethylallyltransferase
VRVQRALEVHRLTGTPISRFWSRQAGTSAAQRLGVQIHEFAIMPARRADLAGPIRTRFEVMLGSGFVDEVAALRARDDLGPGCPSMRAVGYRQVWAYLDGAIDHATLIDRGAAATRALAKKQFTWLKSWNAVQHLPAGRPRSLAERIALMLEIS